MSPGGWLLVSGAGIVAGLACARPAPRLWLWLTWLAAGAALVAAAGVLAGGGSWEWRTAFVLGGECVWFRLDALSAFFVALLALLGGVGALYAQEYWSDAAHPRSAPSGRCWWSALLGSMGSVLVAANGLHFLLAWEMFAVCAYFLITSDRRRREVRSAGWLYLAASHAGTLCLFAFFAGLAARTGGWELGPWRDRADLAPLFWLALLGFGVKAGLFPLHVWLPSAHANAPTHVSALLSGVAIKMGIYGLVRFSGWLPVTEPMAWTVVGLGGVSAVLGVAFALGQHDLKRLLAYHSVENIGIILIGLGFALVATHRGEAGWGRLVLAGGLLHVWNHGLFKALLFFAAGSVLHATGTREMSRLGGLWRAMPWTASCFGLGAVAIVGLPPLNGFISEWLVYLGLFEALPSRHAAAGGAVVAGMMLGMTGALALACFVKVCGVVFLGSPRTPAAARARESGWRMRVPMLILGGACLAIGLGPVWVWPAVARVSAVWHPAWPLGDVPESLAVLGLVHGGLVALAALAGVGVWYVVGRRGVTRQVTWDCGYAEPTARMQYTAGSFAEILTGWFAWALRPRAQRDLPEVLFPARARVVTHTPETVLERGLGPVASGVLAVSTAVRRLQHGRLQSYILYLVAGLAALALLALWGGGP